MAGYATNQVFGRHNMREPTEENPMPPQFLVCARWLVFLIAFFPILACNPLSFVQQESPTAPPAQALATRPPTSTAVSATTAPTVAPTSTRAPTVAPTSTRASTVAPTTTSTAAPKATTGATSTTGASETLIKNALDAMTKKSYRGTVKGPTSSANWEYSLPGNYHILMNGGDYILISETQEAYMKTDGKWTKTDSGAAGLLAHANHGR